MEIAAGYRTLFIGIDGGGSGCRARLADEAGRVLGRGEAPPAAARLGIERALAAVEEAARTALCEAGLAPDALASAHAVVGLAGIGRKSVQAELEAHRTAFGSIAWFNDAMIACVGAHGGRDGGIVIAGTGSVGLALEGGREIRVGGYGFPISDEGSGADLGLRAIRAALRAHDGRIAATNLTRTVMARFGGDPFEAVAFADAATATDYAKFAPPVMDHAEAGDPVACAIVAHAAQEIETLATRLATRGVRRIAFLGGLAQRLTAWLSADMQRLFVPAEGDAIDGALILARRFAARTMSPKACP